MGKERCKNNNKGYKRGFERLLKRNLLRSKDFERRETVLQPSPRFFKPFLTLYPLFHPFFIFLTQNGKKAAKSSLNRKG